MGTDARIVVIGGRRSLVDDAVARVHELECRWSRFRPDSEVSILNRGRGGVAFAVTADTFGLVDRAVTAWYRTAGRYDPTVLASLRANGYDRTFSAVGADDPTPAGPCRPAPGCSAIALDERASTVALPTGTTFDPGGIGKGLAADLVAAQVMAGGADGVLVDLGGDVRVAGAGPESGRWVIEIEHPIRPQETLLRLALTDAGIATSSRSRRRWRRQGTDRHHLIDPATGEPTRTPPVAATVIGRATWWAEVLTKVIFVDGGLDTLAPDTAAIVTDGHGTISATPALRELLP
jgi:thiamine biosynthesis lipoprotein